MQLNNYCDKYSLNNLIPYSTVPWRHLVGDIGPAAAVLASYGLGSSGRAVAWRRWV